MSFIQTQRKLHNQADRVLTRIEALKLTLQYATLNEKERIYGEIGEKQVQYSEVMREITKDYIPYEYQLPNARLLVLNS